MQCKVCYRSTVTRETQEDMCYPKEYTCKTCGAEYLLENEKLILLSSKELALA